MNVYDLDIGSNNWWYASMYYLLCAEHMLVACQSCCSSWVSSLLQLSISNNIKHTSDSRHLLLASELSHQSQKSVSYEDKVCLVSFLIPQYCVHAPYLVVGWDQL